MHNYGAVRLLMPYFSAKMQRIDICFVNVTKLHFNCSKEAHRKSKL